MINRIYIDNYSCFQNFECRLDSVELFLGLNGSGKSTIFTVLEKLRELIAKGGWVDSLFPSGLLTAWDNRTEQRFELGISSEEGQFDYKLVIEHEKQTSKKRIKSEELSLNERSLFSFDGSEARLFSDDGSAGPVFPFDWSRSAIATIPERHDNLHLTSFRQRLRRIFVFSPNPLGMESKSDEEIEECDRYLRMLPSWLRHLLQESTEFSSLLSGSLSEVMEGFVRFRLEKSGENSRVLNFDFSNTDSANIQAAGASPPDVFSLRFHQLSEGQRNLVALFTVLHGAIDQNSTVCIDEPDNYVALREIQPWLTQLKDRVGDCGGQCLLISHHPELINYLASDHGLLFTRDGAGPARVKRFECTEKELIEPAELMARGWE